MPPIIIIEDVIFNDYMRNLCAEFHKEMFKEKFIKRGSYYITRWFIK